jgi:hypothetical protein
MLHKYLFSSHVKKTSKVALVSANISMIEVCGFNDSRNREI